MRRSRRKLPARSDQRESRECDWDGVAGVATNLVLEERERERERPTLCWKSSGQRCVMLFFWSLAFWISLRMLREASR